MTATLARHAARRLCLNGHVDVVGPGTEPWRRGPWSGAIEDGRLHGRGSVDMKGAVIAALHALAALRRAGAETPEVVLQAVAVRGGRRARHLRRARARRRLRRRAAARADRPARRLRPGGRADLQGRRRAAARPTPPSGSRAARRSTATCACTPALHAHETAVNADVAHPLMRELPLPYPLLVGKVAGGEWSSQVPDRLEFEGRLGVPVGADLDEARAALQATVDAALDDGEAPCELAWEGGAFAPGETAPDHPWVHDRARRAARRARPRGRRSPACPGAPTCACSPPAASRR